MNNKLFLSVLFIISTMLMANVVYAYEYTSTTTINTSLPGVKDSGNPLDIIAGFYKFALAISGILAIAVILYGAIKYMASPGSAGGQSDAKEWITSALLGILLLAGAYLILNTINPELTILRLPGLEEIKSSAPPGASTSTIPEIRGEGKYGWSGAKTPPGTLTHEDALSQLANPVNIRTNRNNINCTREGQTDCTSLTGIPQEAINGVIAIKIACKCDVIISGGTEAGHQTHGMGKAILDLSPTPSLNQYIYSISKTSSWTHYQKETINGVLYMWETQPPHWHIVF